MRRRFRKHVREIAPDEIFLDSSNLPAHEVGRFEGRVERPIGGRPLIGIGVAFVFIALLFGSRSAQLQIARGATYADISQENTLERWPIFAARGTVSDRTGTPLAWNEPQPPSGADATTTPYALRRYIEKPGFSILLGFVQYPQADSRGAWWREEYRPVSGVELSYDDMLGGENGSTMVERDAHGKLVRENLVTPPREGGDLALAIDADVQTHLYRLLDQHAKEEHFVGGAAVIMDVRTGELLSLTSFPEYDNNAFTSGETAAVSAAYSDPSSPMLDRAVSGLYAPGSIVKPIFAAAALNENLISPDKKIESVGKISVPNPYDPAHPSVFRDWAVHGWIDMREALAVSSDEYFYTIGGGYGAQPGLGISRIDKYAEVFGLGTTTGVVLPGEAKGVVPSPSWKAAVFGAGDPWRIGDTYHTAIGQYGFQITPIQAARYVAAIANGGELLAPKLVSDAPSASSPIGIPDAYLEIVREGMRLAVTSDRKDATVKVLNIPGISIAAKTGTAQLGLHNEWMNSWSVGFWPSDHPRYAYAVVLEHAPSGTLSGAAPGMRAFFEWLVAAHPEYVQ